MDTSFMSQMLNLSRRDQIMEIGAIAKWSDMSGICLIGRIYLKVFRVSPINSVGDSWRKKGTVSPDDVIARGQWIQKQGGPDE
jgi:hypothetical protein